MTKEVTEQQRAMSDAMANTLKAGRPWSNGMPLFWSLPPGTVAEVAKATVAIRAATKEHDSEVFVSHSSPLFTSSQ